MSIKSKNLEINPFIFRAYDIRGIYGKDIDENVFRLIGFVLGKKNRKFLVGHDIRKSGEKLAMALIEGLSTKGSKVFFCGKSSFGLCFFSGFKLRVYQTLFVTASHLPKEWNGLKINFGDGEPVSSKEIEKIKEKVLRIEKKEIRFKKSKFKRVNLKKEYERVLLKKFPLLKKEKLKIVLDCGNGATSLIAPQIFKKFGFETKTLFCQPNPDFPNRDPEPTFESTKALRERVISEKADFGVAFDGDGDRGVIVDDKGRYLSGNQIGIILGKDILKGTKNKKVVRTVSCSMAIDEELKKYSAKIVETPVGHTFVISGVKRERAVLGIEESNHIVIPDYFLFDDALLIPLKIAEILIKEKRKLSEIVDEIKIYPFEEIVFDCPDEKKFKVVKNLAEKFKKEYKNVNTLDGVKVLFDFGWILIRASNTSPKIRLYLEAKTKDKLEFLKEKFSKILEKWIKQ
jgi:phosphomannomutase